MNKIIAKISLICWGFIVVFVTCLIIAGAIPGDYVGFVSIILGGIILGLFFYDLRKIYLREGFDFGWFLTIKKGYWRILVGLVGVGLFSVGLFATIFPSIANELGEKNWLKIAKVFVILFWTALTSTFLGWELICFSEATVYFRLKKMQSAVGSFAIGILWLLFALLFLSLFLEVINDIFLNLTSTTQNWILIIFAVATITVGLWTGKYEDLKDAGE